MPGRPGRAAGVKDGPVEVVGGWVEWIECVVPQKLRVGTSSKKPVQCGPAASTGKSEAKKKGGGFDGQAGKQVAVVFTGPASVFGTPSTLTTRHAAGVMVSRRGCYVCGTGLGA